MKVKLVITNGSPKVGPMITGWNIVSV